jgi:hypothetical protein
MMGLLGTIMGHGLRLLVGLLRRLRARSSSTQTSRGADPVGAFYLSAYMHAILGLYLQGRSS